MAARKDYAQRRGAPQAAIMSTGMGESKRHNAPEGTFEPGAVDWSKMTVNGHPIPANMMGLIPYHMTDQAQQERDANRDPNSPIIEFGRDETQKQVVDAFAGGIKAGMEPWETPNPFREVVERHGTKGYRHRLLSPAKVDRNGLRGWEPVIVKNENGVAEQVKVGNMILGRMPEDKAKRREAHYKKLAHDQMVSAQDKVRGQQEEMISTAKLNRVAKKNGDAGGDVGFESYRGDPGNLGDADFDD